MTEPIPITLLFDLYSRLQFKGAGREGKSTYGLRLAEADRLLAEPDHLADMFRKSVERSTSYYAGDPQEDPFYPAPRTFKKSPGIGSTDALGHWLDSRRASPWRVLGDPSLDFHYLDREIVATRARGVRLEDGRSSADGPRLDLLLADASTGRPIVGEVKLTSGRGSPDKDTFFALIQALTAAAYLLPRSQMERLRLASHDPQGRIDAEEERLGVYLLTGEAPPHSPIWFELRDRAERLAALVAPLVADRIHTIAGLELAWFKSRPASTRLRLTKRFAHVAPS